MHTENYKLLLSRLHKLKKIYLPRVLSPTGAYKDTTYEKVRAYKVLTHAEMEYYFEEVALSIAQKAFNEWSLNKKASAPLVSLAVYFEGNYSAIPESHTGNKVEEDLDFRIKKAFQFYYKQIRDKNHGVKEKNILNIFLPIGISVADLSEDMLIALNNYGSSRGIIAHSTRAENPVTPDDALHSIEDIMAHISSFDEILCTLLQSI